MEILVSVRKSKCMIDLLFEKYLTEQFLVLLHISALIVECATAILNPNVYMIE